MGSFSARARGEVFLTESDVERLDGLDRKAIALVIGGGIAGFFVREPDGSMQTIKSYQEFTIRAPRLRQPLPHWLPLAIAYTISFALLAWPAQSFTIYQQDAALRIQLHHATGLLEITDGPNRRSIPISPSLTSVLYSPQTSDVHIRLIR